MLGEGAGRSKRRRHLPKIRTIFLGHSNRQADRQDRQTDIVVHREVTFPKTN